MTALDIELGFLPHHEAMTNGTTSPSEIMNKSVQFSGEIDLEQYRIVQKLLLPVWAKPYAFAACISYVFISIGVGWSTALKSPIKALPDLITIGIVFLAYWAMTIYSTKRAWKTHRELHGKVNGVVGPTGVEWNTASTASKFSWEKIVKCKHTHDMTLIFYTPRCAFFFPSSFFTSASDWASFNEIVKEHASIK